MSAPEPDESDLFSLAIDRGEAQKNRDHSARGRVINSRYSTFSCATILESSADRIPFTLMTWPSPYAIAPKSKAAPNTTPILFITLVNRWNVPDVPRRGHRENKVNNRILTPCRRASTATKPAGWNRKLQSKFAQAFPEDSSSGTMAEDCAGPRTHSGVRPS